MQIEGGQYYSWSGRELNLSRRRGGSSRTYACALSRSRLQFRFDLLKIVITGTSLQMSTWICILVSQLSEMNSVPG
jgi:hypothetical protein